MTYREKHLKKCKKLGSSFFLKWKLQFFAKYLFLPLRWQIFQWQCQNSFDLSFVALQRVWQDFSTARCSYQILKHEYDVNLWHQKQRTSNANDHHMPLNKIPLMNIFCVRHCVFYTFKRTLGIAWCFKKVWWID